MLKAEHEALLASLGPRPRRPAGVHDWAPPVDYSYCRKCGVTESQKARAMQECPR
jgi:hypothetical protein